MLFVVFRQLQSDPARGVVTLVGFALSLAVAITVHEFSHALSAYRLGDPTARGQGRLTLDPRAHLDPLGTAMILLAGIGWGKPTLVDPRYLRTGERAGMATVSLAGPLSNILAALLCAIPIKLGVPGASGASYSSYFLGGASDLLGYMAFSLVFWNLLLATFNLLPVAPLDGFKVAVGVLPRGLADAFARSERQGPIILMLLILVDYVFGVGILGSIIRPVFNLLSLLVLGRALL